MRHAPGVDDDPEHLDTAALTALWERRWPGCRYSPHELRVDAADRWVRFHALPGSQRYPGTPAEHATVLRRHRTLLAEVLPGPRLLLVTADYADGPEPPATRRALVAALNPGARHWTSARISDDPGFESWMHLYAGRVGRFDERLDEVLRAVADNRIANVLLADLDLHRLYHPYDGGMDVLLPTTAERDALRERHRAWRPAGGGDL